MKKNISNVKAYKKRMHNRTWLRILQYVVFGGGLFAFGILLIVAFNHSFGNIAEIINLLDKDVYTGEQLEANYLMLIEKYGEWVIGTGSAGFVIRFINIGRALFSGIAIFSFIMSLISLGCSIVFGKYIIPAMINRSTEKNNDMTNMAMLKELEKNRSSD